MTPEPIERLRLDVGRTMRRIGDLLGDFDRLQDDLGRALPSLGELSHAERVEAVSALLGSTRRSSSASARRRASLQPCWRSSTRATRSCRPNSGYEIDSMS